MTRHVDIIARFTKNPRRTVRALLLLLALGLVTPTDAQSKKQEAAVPRQTSTTLAIQPQAVPTNLPQQSSTPRHDTMAQKLDSIVLDEFGADNLPLAEILGRLHKVCQARDQKKRGGYFMTVDEGVLAVPVKTVPALRNITLRQALDAIVQGGRQPIHYSVEHYAVVFSPTNTESKQLPTRWFPIDPLALARALEKALGTNYGTRSVPATPRNPTNNLISNLRFFLGTVGVDLQPPKAIFFNNHLLMVRATLQELDVVKGTIERLNIASPQVAIEVHWCKVDEKTKWELARFIRNGTALTNAAKAMASSAQQAALPPGVATNSFKEVLNDSLFRVVRRALEQRAGSDVVSTGKVTTVSGRQAEIRLQMTGPGRHSQEASFNTEAQPVGPLLEPSPLIQVVPYVAEDGYTISLQGTTTVNEFIGYDLDPASMIWATGGPFATKPPTSARSTTPQPLFRPHQVSTEAVLGDGQTLVLGGFTSTGAKVVKDTVPILGKSALSSQKSLLIFITPTIIDAAGNRIHPDEQVPFFE